MDNFNDFLFYSGSDVHDNATPRWREYMQHINRWSEWLHAKKERGGAGDELLWANQCVAHNMNDVNWLLHMMVWACTMYTVMMVQVRCCRNERWASQTLDAWGDAWLLRIYSGCEMNEVS